MIVLDVEQGSAEWFRARAGIPTASEFSNILTPTGKIPTNSKVDNYRHKLLAEWLVGGEVESYQSQWMSRGQELEGSAREMYCFARDVKVDVVGFVTNDAGTYGCSPDGLIGDSRGLEIKCPAPHTHVSYLLKGKLPTEYIPQIQGSLMVTGRESWDFMSYHPQMAPLILTVERDEKYISDLAEALDRFLEVLEQSKTKLAPYYERTHTHRTTAA